MQQVQNPNSWTGYSLLIGSQVKLVGISDCAKNEIWNNEDSGCPKCYLTRAQFLEFHYKGTIWGKVVEVLPLPDFKRHPVIDMSKFKHFGDLKDINYFPLVAFKFILWKQN